MATQKYALVARNATFFGDDNGPPHSSGADLTVVLSVTAVPGSDTVTPVIEGKDANGVYYTVLQGTAQVATGTQVLYLGNGLPATANVSANAPMPSTYRLRVNHSGGGAFAYSITAQES